MELTNILWNWNKIFLYHVIFRTIDSTAQGCEKNKNKSTKIHNSSSGTPYNKMKAHKSTVKKKPKKILPSENPTRWIWSSKLLLT